MSLDFKCRDWKNKQMVELEGSAKAVLVSGCGTPGIWINMPGNALIPADEFCEVVRYFLTNYDLVENDPRLKLLNDLKTAKQVEGWEDGKKRISVRGA